MTVGGVQITADFSADWIDILRGRLTALGHPPAATEKAEDISFRYFNLLIRRIEPRQGSSWRRRS